MNYYIIAIVVIFGMRLGQSLTKHGEEEKYKYNFYITFIAIFIEVFLLYKAGLFTLFITN